MLTVMLTEFHMPRVWYVDSNADTVSSHMPRVWYVEVILAESHVTLVSYVEKAEMTGGMSWHVEAGKTGRLRRKKRVSRENEFGIL